MKAKAAGSCATRSRISACLADADTEPGPLFAHLALYPQNTEMCGSKSQVPCGPWVFCALPVRVRRHRWEGKTRKPPSARPVAPRLPLAFSRRRRPPSPNCRGLRRGTLAERQRGCSPSFPVGALAGASSARRLVDAHQEVKGLEHATTGRVPRTTSSSGKMSSSSRQPRCGTA